jgi:hypothetical protein
MTVIFVFSLTPSNSRAFSSPGYPVRTRNPAPESRANIYTAILGELSLTFGHQAQWQCIRLLIAGK